MQRSKLTVLAGTAIIAVAAPATNAAAAVGTSVTVRVEGKSRTLLAPTVVQAHSGWITAGRVAPGRCSALSGQGALDVATHHRWAGKFSTSLGNYFITSILGETDNGPRYYWSIFVNNKPASTGACEIKLRRGDQVLFAAATYPEYPIGVTAPSSATVGRQFKLTVSGFTAAGKSKPLAGARVTGSGVSVTSNGKGVARVSARKAGSLVLRATDKGHIRSAPVTIRIVG